MVGDRGPRIVRRVNPAPEATIRVGWLVALAVAVNALVLCVDEKSQIQALNRTQPILPMRPGQVERRTPEPWRDMRFVWDPSQSCSGFPVRSWDSVTTHVE